MSLSILALAAFLQTTEPPANVSETSYEPVAYDRPAADGTVNRVTLPTGKQTSPAAPKRVRQANYVSRGMLGRIGQDQDERQGPPSGLRVEIRTGWDRITLGAVDDDDRSDGLLYGFAAGYDWALTDRIFVGLFTGMDGSSVKKTGTVATSPDPLSGEVLETQFETEVSHVTELGVRAGWWIRKGWNVYADTAITRLTVDVDSEVVAITPFLDPLTNTTSFIRSEPLYGSVSDTVTGWRIGAGTEALLTDNIYTTAKYRFTTYDEDDAGAETDQFEILTGVGLRF